LPLAVGPAISASGGSEGEAVFIATLIAQDRLGAGDISAAEDALGGARGRAWVEQGSACDILLSGDAAEARVRLEGLIPGVDVVVQSEERRRKRLLVADMDSTMIEVECIDELADYAGLKAEIAAVTERAMQGEIDFEEALAERVALLRGLEEGTIERCAAERVRITPGAKALVRTMRREGAYCLLVSGGFTRFADPIAEEIGFHAAVANRLGIEGGLLSGSVDTPIVGAEGKREALVKAAREHGVDLIDALAIGDGANDVPMLEAAGLAVAYKGKPAATRAAKARIDHNDLSALLYAQGYPRSEWAED
jgi:phosphoserine phosphatase